MDNELFELCKEVYERTEWNDTETWFVKTGGKSPWTYSFGPISSVIDGNIPRYMSDYLLEKFEGYALTWPEFDFNLSYLEDNKLWEAQSPEMSESADTPLKALLKLVIALDDAKELK